jgi:calcineurin-like phosphoesterase family protein
VRGNHDRGRFSFYRQCGFQIVKPFEIRWGDKYVVSFSHYPWNEEIEGHAMPANMIRVHGHIHNNGYTRDAYVPFLKNHINVSVEQTHYRPVNLALLLGGALGGVLPGPLA